MINLKVEVSRKIMHVSSCVLGFSILCFDRGFYIPVLLLATVLTVLLDFSRIHYKPVRKIFNIFFNIFTRDSEHNQITGASFLFIGASIVAVIFDQEIASAGMLILSFSDSSAAIIGILFGNTKLFNKSLEGSTAFFVTTFIILHLLGFGLIQNLSVCLITTIVELLSSYKYNDNITIPLSACISIYLTNLI